MESGEGWCARAGIATSWRLRRLSRGDPPVNADGWERFWYVIGRFWPPDITERRGDWSTVRSVVVCGRQWEFPLPAADNHAPYSAPIPAPLRYIRWPESADHVPEPLPPICVHRWIAPRQPAQSP